MSLDGLRAWIGEVERKLGARTRVFLVLTTIAVGAAAAGLYLGLDAQDDAVSESDVRAMESRLQKQIGTTSGAGTDLRLNELEAQVKALQAEVEALKGGQAGAGGEAKGDGGTSAKAGGSSETSSQASGDGAAPAATDEAIKALEKRAEEIAGSGGNEEKSKAPGDEKKDDEK